VAARHTGYGLRHRLAHRGTHGSPVPELGAARLDLTGAALEVGDPRVGSAGVLGVVETGDEVARQPRTLLRREREGVPTNPVGA
jgi:hypothetical protein